jgi:Leucine-rich repeat (LRR) protein
LQITDDNDLSGPIPTQVGSLNSLHTLDLGTCGLDENQSTAFIVYLTIVLLVVLQITADNNLSEPIPTQVGLLTSLQTLYLRTCGLDENHSTAFIVYLTIVLLVILQKKGRNALSGPIPSHVGSLISLQYIFLGTCGLDENQSPAFIV